MHLKHYWTFNNVAYLEIEMRGANEVLPHLRCRCLRCYPSKSKCQAEAVCKFRPWFLNLLEEVGLTYSIKDELTEAEEKQVHLVIPLSMNSSIDANNEERKTSMRYGGKIKNARFDSVDLKMLDSLFEILAQQQEVSVV